MGEIVIYMDAERPLATTTRILLDGHEISGFVNRAALVSDVDAGLNKVELTLIGKIRIVHDEADI